MERFYDDAFQIDGLIKKGKIMVKNIENNKQASNILKGSSLGRGEISSLHLYFNLNAEAIISDDRAFLSVLQQNNIAFITPADLIVRSFELRILSTDESSNALDMIEPYICNYEKAKSDMEV
jgi:predicted nucleic acid-binding protein